VKEKKTQQKQLTKKCQKFLETEKGIEREGEENRDEKKNMGNCRATLIFYEWEKKEKKKKRPKSRPPLKNQQAGPDSFSILGILSGPQMDRKGVMAAEGGRRWENALEIAFCQMKAEGQSRWFVRCEWTWKKKTKIKKPPIWQVIACAWSHFSFETILEGRWRSCQGFFSPPLSRRASKAPPLNGELGRKTSEDRRILFFFFRSVRRFQRRSCEVEAVF